MISLSFNTRELTSPNGSLTFSAAHYDGEAQGVYIRGISIEDQGIFWSVFRGCIGFLVALLVIQSLLTYISIDSFIKPLEKAAAHLKLNKKVDVAGLVSVDLFARYWSCVIGGMAAAIIFLALILVVIQTSMANTILKKVQLAIGFPGLFWETQLGNLSIMTRILVSLPYVRALLDQPTNTTLLNEVSTTLAAQAKKLKMEHMLITNSTSHVIWSAHPGSELVRRREDTLKAMDGWIDGWVE